MSAIVLVLFMAIMMSFGMALLFNVRGFRDTLVRRSGDPRFGSARSTFVVIGAFAVAIPLYGSILIISDFLAQ